MSDLPNCDLKKLKENKSLINWRTATRLPLSEFECWNLTCRNNFPEAILENGLLIYFPAFLCRWLQLNKSGKLMLLFRIKIMSLFYVIQFCIMGSVHLSLLLLELHKNLVIQARRHSTFWKTEIQYNELTCQYKRASWYQPR